MNSLKQSELNSKEILISIIVPIYNSESTISKCINSILEPGVDNIEIILIDDGSKDDSFEVCKQLQVKSSNIKLIHKENGGVGSARNVGINLSRGEWITFVDSDDYITNFKNTIQYINSQSKYDLIIFNHYTFTNGNLLPNRFPSVECTNQYEINDFLTNNIATSTMRVPWSKFYKKGVINELRFDEHIRIGEDTDFLFRYLNRCNSLIATDSYYYIWTSPGEDVTAKYKLSVEESIYSASRIFESYNALGIKSHQTVKFIYQFYRSLCEADIKKRAYLWYGNDKIWKLWKTIHRSFSMTQRFKQSMLHFICRGIAPLLFNKHQCLHY